MTLEYVNILAWVGLSWTGCQWKEHVFGCCFDYEDGRVVVQTLVFGPVAWTCCQPHKTPPQSPQSNYNTAKYPQWFSLVDHCAREGNEVCAGLQAADLQLSTFTQASDALIPFCGYSANNHTVSDFLFYFNFLLWVIPNKTKHPEKELKGQLSAPEGFQNSNNNYILYKKGW